MENLLWSDIQAQGENLPHVVHHLFSSERARLEAAADFLRNDKPIALIGVASAAYLCMPAAAYLGGKGRFASVSCASEGLYTLLPMLEGANVVINSRSGETIEVVKLANALHERGIPFVLITNEVESAAARLAKHIVWADTHKDALVSINVVTGMMTATLALAAAACGELEKLRPELEALAGRMAGVVAEASRRSGQIHDLLGGTRPIYLLHRGASAGAAYCGRLAMEEIARTPGIAMGAAEFRQGPNEVVDERFGAVVFVPGGKPGELNLRLVEDILRSGGKVLAVGEVACLDEHPNLVCFDIPGVSDTLRPVLDVVPVQLLAYELAKAQGYEPGSVRYIAKVIVTEEGIPKEG